jgi:oxygen-independent coproporphyrinogen-3 oxidase
MTEEALSSAGFGWYEVSNWATSTAGRCRHNELYWRGADWWGAGPGAHSHVGGVRWWNVKHPGAYAQALGEDRSPGAGREVLSAEDRRVERILLELRLVDGCPLDLLAPAGAGAAARALADGLLERAPYERGRAVLTLRGRLLADAVVRDLVD